MRFGTRVMKCEEILKVVEKVWNSKEDLVTISRGWMSHHQVIAATYYMNGDNAYLTHKDGLDFGIRYNFSLMKIIQELLGFLSLIMRIHQHRKLRLNESGRV